MFKKSFLIQPSNGFVPFSDLGGAAKALAPADTAVAPQSDHWARTANARTTWEAPAGVGVRRVEMAILITVCGYFTFGLGGLLGLY